MTTLVNLETGKVGRLKTFESSLEEDTLLSNRLKELGFLPGETVEILNRAPFFHDPISVRVRGGIVAIRVAEAKRILIDEP